MDRVLDGEMRKYGDWLIFSNDMSQPSLFASPFVLLAGYCDPHVDGLILHFAHYMSEDRTGDGTESTSDRVNYYLLEKDDDCPRSDSEP